MTCGPDHKHGETKTCYNNHRCRCDDCRSAATARQFWYKNMIRAGKYQHPDPVIDGTGTRRRLQALAFMGWSTDALGEHMGITGSRVRQLMYAETVGQVNADKVRETFVRLWDAPAPQLFHSVRIRNHARRQGWVGPLAWDEDIDNPDAVPDVDGSLGWSDTDLIEAALNGEKPNLTPEQRREVITILNERRWHAHRIADHIGCATDTVHRIRNQLNLPVYLANGTHMKDGTVSAA